MGSFIAVYSDDRQSVVVKVGATRLVTGHAIFSGDVTRNVEKPPAAARAAL
jgi:hypothetical protein